MNYNANANFSVPNKPSSWLQKNSPFEKTSKNVDISLFEAVFPKLHFFPDFQSILVRLCFIVTEIYLPNKIGHIITIIRLTNAAKLAINGKKPLCFICVESTQSKKSMNSSHPYLAKLSNQVFLAQNKYYHLKLLAENGEFNEMMGIIIKGVPYK